MKNPPTPTPPSPVPVPAPTGTLVWDAPVRVFHWLLAASFALAWLTGESERWQHAHLTAGYTMAGLVVFRLLWGLVGTRHARFRDFVRGPWAAIEYLDALADRRPEHHVGHNPAGGIAIVGLLGLAALTAASGWGCLHRIPGRWMNEVHELLASMMLGLVVLHILGVIVGSVLHRENLVAAMIHGRKPVPPDEGIRRPWRSVAAVLLAAVLGFWWLQWPSTPTGEPLAVPIRHHRR